MFNEAKVHLKKASLKILDRDSHLERVAELTCVIEPFTPALAHELGEEIAGHLFDDADKPRHELDAVTLRAEYGPQIVTSRWVRDGPTEIKVYGLSVLGLSASKQEDAKGTKDPWLRFAFVLLIPLEERRVRDWLINRFGAEVYLGFAAMQADLPLGERMAQAVTDPENPAVQEFARKVAKRQGPGESVSLQARNGKITITSEPTKPAA